MQCRAQAAVVSRLSSCVGVGPGGYLQDLLLLLAILRESGSPLKIDEMKPEWVHVLDISER